MTVRKNAPVFVLGSPRSGTTLFYHMLLSAGDFAVYRTETHVFNMLVPHFGDLRVRRNREVLLREWLPSEFFRRSGLEAEVFRAKILEQCRSGGDFLCLLMESICEKQNLRRWSECTPEHLAYVHEIKRAIPDALIVHMIRDGRDVALSMSKQGWVRPFPWDKGEGTIVAGLFWEWLVERGRVDLRAYASDTLEVRYEDLVMNPREVLARVAPFIEHDLNYDRILEVGIGSVRDPNTSFRSDVQEGNFNPVGRWRKGYTDAELARLESAIGPFLNSLGYELASTKQALDAAGDLQRMRSLYRSYFNTKRFLKAHTPLGRFFVNTAMLRDFHAFDQDRLAPEQQLK